MYLFRVAKGCCVSLTGITNGFHLVDVIIINDVVECCVELVKEVNNLVRSAAAGQLGEADNITTKAHTYILLWWLHKCTVEKQNRSQSAPVTAKKQQY